MSKRRQVDMFEQADHYNRGFRNGWRLACEAIDEHLRWCGFLATTEGQAEDMANLRHYVGTLKDGREGARHEQ